MKISEMNTDRVVDVLCEISIYANNIFSDPDVKAEMVKFISPDKSQQINSESVLEVVTKALPLLLKTHKNDVYGIVSLVNEKTVDEIANQNIMQTMTQIREIIQDRELLNFFKPCVSEGTE